MSEFIVDVEASVIITVNDQEAVTRITGDGGDEWRDMFYDLFTEDDVLEHWAYNALHNGIDRANRLDGWADLPDDAVMMRAEPSVELNGIIRL